MQYTFPSVNSIGHNEQSGEPFCKIAQGVQVNTQSATNDFAGRESQEGYMLAHVSCHTHRRYDEPRANERCASAVANTTKSCTIEPPSLRNRDRDHSADLYIGVRGTKCRAFSLSRSKASVHATMNHCQKRSTRSEELHLRSWQAYRTHSRTTRRPPTPSDILARSRFASDPSL